MRIRIHIFIKKPLFLKMRISIMCKLLFFIPFFIPLAWAQSREELILQLENSSSDSVKMNILDELCWTLAASDKNAAQAYGYEYLSLSQKLKDEPQRAQALNNLGAIYLRYGQYDSALILFKECEEIRMRHDLQQALASVRSKMGVAYMEQGKYLLSLQKHLQAHETFEALGDPGTIGLSLNNLGILYEKLNKPHDALRCYEKALNTAQGTGNKYAIYTALGNLGVYYEKQNEHERALDYYHQARITMLENKDYSNAATAMNNIGLVYRKMQKFEPAIESYLQALKEAYEINDQHLIALSASNLGALYVMQKKWNQALRYLEEALPIAEKIGVRTVRRNCYTALASVYENTGRLKEAITYLHKYEIVKDSLFNEENMRIIEEMQTRFETEQKEKEITLKNIQIQSQEDRNQIQLLTFIFLAVSGSLGGFLVYNQNRVRTKIRMEAERSKLQKEQFNAVILAEEKERKRVAQDLHDGLGQLLSAARLNVSVLEDIVSDKKSDDHNSLKISLELLDEACSEVRNISHNLMPGALIRLGFVAALQDLVRKVNAGDKMQIQLEMSSPDFKPDETLGISLYRICQEVIANTLRHAEAQNLLIQINILNNQIHMTLQDDGKGIEANTIKQSTGLGWHNIYSRVSLLNGNCVVSKGSIKGTRTEIRIPFVQAV